MQNLACYLRSVLFFLLLIFLFISQNLLADTLFPQQVSSGWLRNFNHQPVAVQMLLTGEKDPALNTVNAVLQLELQGDWKTYWRSPGDGGAAPQFDFSPSSNIRDLVWAWPAPNRYNVLGVDTLGYKGRVDFPLTVHLQDASKAARLKGKLTIASCTNICVLSDYQIDLPFSSDALVVDQQYAFIYQQAMASVPLKLQQNQHSEQPIRAWRSDWDAAQQLLNIEVEGKTDWHSPDIFVDSVNEKFIGVTFSAPEVSVSGNKMNAKIAVSSWAGKLDLNKQLLNLTLVDNNFAVELTSRVGEQREGLQPLLSMFVIALIGGLILNVMPCVLPVLALKLTSILTTEGIARRQIRMQFIASSLGILSSFWLLAAFLLMLKFSGQVLGWGIQFQNPYFLIVMVIITALFAANMLNLFTIALPANMQTWLATKGSHSYLGYYLQGMFATLLATPCSAPFLGTAVAFSLGASSGQLFVIFTALGLGMALPWLLIAAFPRIALCLPKPGKWMNSLKTVLALLILATSYWLLSLLGSFIGPSLTLLTALVLTVCLLFLIASRRGKPLFLLVSSVIIITIAGLFLPAHLTARAGERAMDLQWQPLQRSAIEQQVAQGKLVFVDVTADWCITCKANKIAVLLQEPVYSKLQQKNIITMQGDWTLASKRVSEYLQSYGRFAVPFNIVYGPGAPKGIPLPTLLTTEAVLAALQQAK